MNDKDIKQAFEAMSPTAEAEDRMLANILAAANEHSASTHAQHATTPEQSASTHAQHETTPEQNAENIPLFKDLQEKRTDISWDTFSNSQISQPRKPQIPKRRSPWKIALPLAACLVLLVGIGVFMYTSLIVPIEENMTAMQSSTAESAGKSAESQAPQDGGSSSGSAAPDSKESPDANDHSATPLENTAPLIGDVSSAYAYEYPLIEIDGRGTTSLIDPDSPANPDLVGKEIGSATAYSKDRKQSVSCTIYEYPTTGMPYIAVKYPGDDNFYLALDPAAK